MNNGILLVVAVRKGKVVIKTAYENYLPLDNNFLSEMNKELEGNFEKQQYSQGIVSFVYSLEDKLNQKDEAKNNKIIKFGLDKNKKLTPEEKIRLEIAEGAKEGEKIGMIIVLFTLLFLIFLLIILNVLEELKKKKLKKEKNKAR